MRKIIEIRKGNRFWRTLFLIAQILFGKFILREISVLGKKLISGSKYLMTEQYLNEFSMQMNLTVLNLDKHDFGGYVCISSNALGKAEGVVRLQGKNLDLYNNLKYILTH